MDNTIPPKHVTHQPLSEAFFTCSLCAESKRVSDFPNLFKFKTGKTRSLCDICTIENRKRVYHERKESGQKMRTKTAQEMNSPRNVYSADVHKKCAVCGEEKPIDRFKITNYSKHTRESRCMQCFARMQQRRADSKRMRQEEERTKNLLSMSFTERLISTERSHLSRHIMSNYGMSLARYDEMVESQKGACAICKQPPDERFGLFVDHDHKTGFVRGLLCIACNSGLGHFKDDILLLQQAIEYLQHSGWEF